VNSCIYKFNWRFACRTALTFRTLEDKWFKAFNVWASRQQLATCGLVHSSINLAPSPLSYHLSLISDWNQPLLAHRKHSIAANCDRDDAFFTLPFSLVYIAIFIFLVIAHLKVWERQQVERGLYNWITGYGGNLEDRTAG